MARTVANSFKKHPLRFTIGLVIDLGGVVALAAHL